MPSPNPQILSSATWKRQAAAHRARAREWTEPFRQRRARGKRHPVYDFLFVYYRYSPAKLEAWHPGLGVALETDPSERTLFRKHYRSVDGVVELDRATLDAREHPRLEFILRLAQAIEARPAQFGCSGLHEWAMVYRGTAEGEIRHGESLPLRLSQPEVDAVVEKGPIVCSHYDAFRFFTSSARPFNRLQPKKETRVELEQCGCLHTNMDLYRWATESMPWVGTELLWACWKLALRARELDMQASAYDCRSLGYEPIQIETPAGRAEYERRQREISEAAKPLRRELITRLEEVLS